MVASFFVKKIMNWLNEDLKRQVRQVFEPRYQRSLKDQEVIQIASNLTNFMEDTLRFRWKKYGNVTR